MSLEKFYMDDKLQQSLDILKNGGIIVFPTDTAFGIGCRMDDENAVNKLYEIRQRPITQASPVLISTIDMAKKYLTEPLPEVVLKLMERYWPGALTIIYTCKTELVPEPVRGGGTTLGVRMPNHLQTLKMIEKTGVPLLGPSANYPGRTTPHTFEDLDMDLVNKTDLLINGECSLKQASTIIDCTVNPYKIIRQGAVVL